MGKEVVSVHKENGIIQKHLPANYVKLKYLDVYYALKMDSALLVQKKKESQILIKLNVFVNLTLLKTHKNFVKIVILMDNAWLAFHKLIAQYAIQQKIEP